MTTKLLAFGAEFERVDAIEQIIQQAADTATAQNRLLDAREVAVMIETILSRPVDGTTLHSALRHALLTTPWDREGAQTLRSVVRFLGTEGLLRSDSDDVLDRLAAAVLTIARQPTVEMVDAGQRELEDGATNFMRIWLKAWERA